MSDRNVNPKVTYVNYHIFLIQFFTFDNILNTIQASDKKIGCAIAARITIKSMDFMKGV